MGRDYSSFTREQLLAEITSLERRHKRKFGLVWEDKPEDVAIKCQTELPILRRLPSKRVFTADDAPVNILIEGDNYHALSVLNYTHAGKIDVIYIDPPYNTGAKDWRYNNSFVDNTDGYRHSKWLSMMHKRLVLARNLLKEDGVLICAIDHNESNRLALLLEQVFPDTEIHCIVIVHNPRGIQGNNFSYTHENAYYVFRKNQTPIGPRRIKEEDRDWNPLRNWGTESERTDAKNCFYPIYVSGDKIIGFGDVCDADYHPSSQAENKGDYLAVYPLDAGGKERKWRYARQSVESIAHLLRVRPVRGRIEVEIGKDTGTVKTVWQDTRYDSNKYGTQLVKSLVPDAPFDFPKSIWNTYDCIIPILESRPHAIVLDFFAGSGTTGHAAMLLNRDGGKRTFILCTNNENGIAEEVCFPRLKRAIQGQPDLPEMTGFPANLEYFKTDFVTKSRNTDTMKVRITEACTEMLCLREGAFQQVVASEEFAVFTSLNKAVGIYYSLDLLALEDLRLLLLNLPAERVLYCFTLDPLGLNAEDFAEWDDTRLEPIPQKILDIYGRIHGS